MKTKTIDILKKAARDVLANGYAGDFLNEETGITVKYLCGGKLDRDQAMFGKKEVHDFHGFFRNNRHFNFTVAI